MNYAQTLTLSITTWLTTVLISALTSIAWAAPVTDGQVRACLNAAILQLNGVPRSTISASPDVVEPDGLARVNWTTQEGGAGTCWVDAGNQVIDFQINVSVRSRLTQSGRPLAAAAAGSTVRVATGGGALNVRSGPHGEIISSAADGSTLVLTGQTDGEWVEVEGGGWVSQYLLEPTDAASAASPETSTGSAPDPATSIVPTGSGSANEAIVATEGGINVRDVPAGDAVIASFPNGARINLTGNRDGEWVEVEGGGWVYGAYLQY